MDFEAIEMGLRQSPLLLAMYERMDKDPARFQSEAKRQHFVPQHLLRKFASERGGKHYVFQLEAGRGANRRVDVATAASNRHFYAWITEEGTRNNQIEGYLSWVEGYAAPALERFLEAPDKLTDADRGTLSYFLALQYQRTPEAARLTAATQDTTMRMLLASDLADPARFAQESRARLGDEGEKLSDEELEEVRHSLLDDLRTGATGFANPQAHALHAGLQLASSALYFIFGMSWELVLGEGFVTSDRAVFLYDPSPSFPWSSEGLLSSDDAQTVFPLSDTACLILRPSGERITTRPIDQERVEEINLRTYGWAGRFIFGRTHDDVVAVHRAARARPDRVSRPRPMQHPFLFEADMSDRTVAERNLRRGWPAYIVSEGIPHDYLVLKAGENPVDAALLISAKVAERARRMSGLKPGEALLGEERTEVISPDKIQGSSATSQILSEWRLFVEKFKPTED